MLKEDYVYYLKVNGELLYDHVFESEEEAIQYAEANELIVDEIVEWNCD